MSRNKKTDEKSRGRHAMPEENNKKNNDKQIKQKQQNMRIKKQEPVKAKKKVKTVRKVKRVVVTILLLAIILAGTLFGYKIYQNGGGLTGALATILGEDTEKLQNLEPIQVLIMGESGVDDYKLADTIMVASYNPKTQAASLMSIPRDTYVGRKNRNTATQNYLASYKINTVFRSGTNIPEAIDRINALTGLNLENYVIIDTKALIKLVDAIGGVTFNVPIDMHYTEDTDQNLYIDLKAGEQLIDGAKAEQLLRFRHNNDGSTYPSSYGQQDLGRMRTQREFIIATLKQTLKPQNIFKLKQVIDIMSGNVKTNLDFNEIKAYVPYAINFNVDNLKSAVLPGTSVGPTQSGNLYAPYWFILTNKTEAQKVIESLYSENYGNETDENSNTDANDVGQVSNIPTDETNKIKIELLNASGSKSKLTKVQKLLKEKGYNVKTGEANITSKTTIINNTDVDNKYTEQVKEILGIGLISSNSTSSNNTDITIIIGKDYK